MNKEIGDHISTRRLVTDLHILISSNFTNFILHTFRRSSRVSVNLINGMTLLLSVLLPDEGTFLFALSVAREILLAHS